MDKSWCGVPSLSGCVVRSGLGCSPSSRSGAYACAGSDQKSFRYRVGNPVTAVLMAYRALDTMLEKVVLLLALVAVWSLAPDRFWGGRAAFGHLPEPDRPLIFLTRVLAPVGMIAGIYLFWVGADAPGGAFAGGAILSAMWILAFLCGSQRRSRRGRFRPADHSEYRHHHLSCRWSCRHSDGRRISWLIPPALPNRSSLPLKSRMTLSIGATLGLLVAGAPRESLKTMSVPTIFGICAAGLVGHRAFLLDRRPATVSKNSRFQCPGQRSLFVFRRSGASWCGGGIVRRSHSTSIGYHRHCSWILGHGTGGCSLVETFRGNGQHVVEG